MGTTKLGQGRRSWVRDDEAGSGTIGFGVQRERSVLGGSILGCDDLAGGAIGAMRV